MFLCFNIYYYLWEGMNNATCENTFNTAVKENPFLKSQDLMNAGMGYSLQSLFEDYARLLDLIKGFYAWLA